MIPGAFDYHRPTSLEEAVALLAEHGDDSRLFAGGHSLIPMMKLRLANPTHLIDLAGIAGLTGTEKMLEVAEDDLECRRPCDRSLETHVKLTRSLSSI